MVDGQEWVYPRFKSNTWLTGNQCNHDKMSIKLMDGEPYKTELV